MSSVCILGCRRAGLIVVAAWLGCSGNQTEVVPRSFERPFDVAFGCFDASSAQFVDTSACATTVSSDSTSPLRLTAFVSQTSRGELASVDLETDGEGGIIDLNQQVPGYTFLTIGEIPYAVATTGAHPERVYVANFGSQTVQAVPSASLRRDAAPSSLALSELPLGGGPTSVRASPDGAFLWVTVPRRGAVVQIPLLADGSLGPPQEIAIPLPSAVPPSVLASTANASFLKLCPPDASLVEPPSPDEVTPRPPVVIGDGSGNAALPQPTSLAVDAERGLLLLSDVRYPLLHTFRFDAQGIAVGSYQAAATGVPILQAAVTPLVPSALGTTTADRRYVFAIDATDESVLVLDASGEDAASWPVLLVNASDEPPDRISLPTGARTIEVVTPDYPSGGFCEPGRGDEANATGSRLRGVFLAAGLDDGTVTIIDAFDFDAACRGGEGCQNPPNADDARIAIRSLRPRLASPIQGSVAVSTTPQIFLNGSPFRLNADGSVATDLAPSLAPLAACPFAGPMQPIYPPADIAGAPLVCAIADAWTALEEQWFATYEGFIPGTNGGRGRLVTGPLIGGIVAEGIWLIDDDARFCRYGLLGRDDVPAAGEPESGYGGDQFVLTGELTEPQRDREECRALVEDELGNERSVALPILRAYQGALQLASTTLGLPSASLALVQSCFDGLFAYEVRSREAYSVVGTRTGFLNRMTAAATDQRCIFDATKPIRPTRFDSYLVGRALPNRLYQNPRVAFQIVHSAATDSNLREGATAQLSFDVSQVPDRLSVDLSSSEDNRPVLPSSVRYNAINGRLYLVDAASRGLIELRLDTFGTFRVFE